VHDLVPLRVAPRESLPPDIRDARMKTATRNRLLFAAVVALVVTLVAWYATLPRPTYDYADTLVQIVYDKAAGEMRYIFSVPITVGGGGWVPASAFLRSFTVTSSDADPATADALVSALLQGGKQGGTPFVPEVDEGHTTLTTSSVPPVAVQDSYPAMTLGGYGTMAFVMARSAAD
jgi:hypothetical protein